jgi:glycosyltransferase involved in cell wall biosynthesis
MSSASPRISAIIAARNASSTLSRCLGAIVAQASDELEVVVVDDYSTDDTRAVASRYPVRLVALPSHAGVAAARNRGAEAARGEVMSSSRPAACSACATPWRIRRSVR